MATDMIRPEAHSDFDLFNLPYFNLEKKKKTCIIAPYYRSTLQ